MITSRYCRWVLPCTCLLVALLFAVEEKAHAGPAAGGGAKAASSKKAPSPARQLLQAYKNLLRTKGYETQLSVQGGLSKTEDHKIYQLAVKANYSGAVYGGLLHVTSEQTFKTQKKGVRKIDGQWKSLVADREGKILHSFFNFPREVLEQALRHARKAQWLDAKGSGAGVKAGSDKTAGSPAGKTAVGGVDGQKADGSEGVPRVLLVEVPPREALQHYIRVENSGCLGGG